MSVEDWTEAQWLRPRWFIGLAWQVHRGVYRGFGGRKRVADRHEARSPSGS
jgi:hypothetical protein